MERKEVKESREEHKPLLFKIGKEKTVEASEERDSSFSVPGRRNAFVMGRFILIDHTDDILRSL